MCCVSSSDFDFVEVGFFAGHAGFAGLGGCDESDVVCVWELVGDFLEHGFGFVFFWEGDGAVEFFGWVVNPCFCELLESVWCFCVGSDSTDDDWGCFDDCGCSHDFFAEVGAAFSVFDGEDVCHAGFEACEA